MINSFKNPAIMRILRTTERYEAGWREQNFIPHHEAAGLKIDMQQHTVGEIRRYAVVRSGNFNGPMRPVSKEAFLCLSRSAGVSATGFGACRI